MYESSGVPDPEPVYRNTDIATIVVVDGKPVEVIRPEVVKQLLLTMGHLDKLVKQQAEEIKRLEAHNHRHAVAIRKLDNRLGLRK